MARRASTQPPSPTPLPRVSQGPITLADYVGLDVCLFILEGWIRDFPDEPAFIIPDCLREMVAQGKLGRKTGQGFYKWEGDKRME